MRIPRPVPLLALSVLTLIASGGGAAAPVAVAETPPAVAAPAPQAKAVPGMTKPGPVKAAPPRERERVSAGLCRGCHRIQYDSWVKSGHARKALDCEGCHGNGSEYATNKVMKDPAAAKAAGLIFQTAAFCAKCHPTADASFLPKAHAHKKK
jgi:hypothetical protein